MLALVPMLLALAAAEPGDDNLICSASFYESGWIGYVALVVGPDYEPVSLTVSLDNPDGWSRATIRLDPKDRRLPGLFESAFFAVRFTRAPALPLTVNGYADGVLRWRRVIHVPFWATSLDRSAKVKRVGRGAPGTVDYVSRAEDGQPVPTPRQLRIVLIDARGRQVGETLHALPVEPGGPVARALAGVETGFQARQCRPPPPLID